MVKARFWFVVRVRLRGRLSVIFRLGLELELGLGLVLGLGFGLELGLGVTSSGDGVNSMSSGRFAGMRIFRGAHGYNHTATVDQAEIYGDQIYLKDTFDVSRGFEFEIAQLPVGKVINMNNVYTSIVSLWRCWLHANNVAFDFNNNDLRRAIINEYNDHGRNI